MNDSGGLFAAWLVGEGIVAWRQYQVQKGIPTPGSLLGVTVLFAALALVSDVWPSSSRFVMLAAFGLDLAGIMNILYTRAQNYASSAAQNYSEAEAAKAAAAKKAKQS